MASAARDFFGFGCLVYCSLEVQRRFRVLLEQLVMTDHAIAICTFQVRGVIEGHVPILGRKREFFRGFLLLGNKYQCSCQARGQQTRDENAHATNVSVLGRPWVPWVQAPLTLVRRTIVEMSNLSQCVVARHTSCDHSPSTARYVTAFVSRLCFFSLYRSASRPIRRMRAAWD
jgi:hypothetical protein